MSYHMVLVGVWIWFHVVRCLHHDTEKYVFDHFSISRIFNMCPHLGTLVATDPWLADVCAKVLRGQFSLRDTGVKVLECRLVLVSSIDLLVTWYALGIDATIVHEWVNFVVLYHVGDMNIVSWDLQCWLTKCCSVEERSIERIYSDGVAATRHSFVLCCSVQEEPPS